MLVLCALVVSLLNVFSMCLLFLAMDALAHAAAAGIAFALAIASSLVFFTLYSLLWLREKCYLSTLSGLVEMVFGGMLISSK